MSETTTTNEQQMNTTTQSTTTAYSEGEWFADRTEIFVCDGARYSAKVASTKMPFIGRDEQIGNANLLAAAPEMLAICEGLSRRWATGEPTTWEHIEAVRAVIARANGTPCAMHGGSTTCDCGTPE